MHHEFVDAVRGSAQTFDQVLHIFLQLLFQSKNAVDESFAVKGLQIFRSFTQTSV